MSIEAGSPARLLLQADVFSMKRTLKYSRRTITERRQEKMSKSLVAYFSASGVTKKVAERFTHF